MKYAHLLFALVLLLSVALATERIASVPPAAKEIADRFSRDRMRADVQFLSSDLLEGRGTGQRGGDIAAAYIATQFAVAGLKPLGDNGAYMQEVPLIGLLTQPESTLKIVPSKGEAWNLKYLDDYVANALTLNTEESFDAPLVFVGYGVNAPEFQWNDYAGADVKGKVILALVNDPPSQDPKFFGGKAMTYYGRWTYKYEEAARRQAAGIFLIHNTQMASYGWNVVRNSNSGQQAYLESPPDQYLLPLAGWITEEAAGKVVASANLSISKLFEMAGTPGFKAMELPARIQGRLLAKVAPMQAQNVVAVLEGSDPKMKEEAIVYTAHYDHLGIGNPVDGDNIYNGAFDNATGCGLLLELARVFAASEVRPPRSIVFLAVTAEERGLRGSEYYGKNPKFPADKTMLNLNYDGISPWGETRDVVLTGADRTSVWPIVQEMSSALNLVIAPEEHPEAGFYYRSDHFSLARVGIPAFSLDLGNDYIDKPKEYGEQKYQEFNKKHYHQPSDEYDPGWDFSGAKQAARLGIYIGWRVAEQPEPTGWRPGEEFEKARRSPNHPPKLSQE